MFNGDQYIKIVYRCIYNCKEDLECFNYKLIKYCKWEPYLSTTKILSWKKILIARLSNGVKQTNTVAVIDSIEATSNQ